MNIIYPIFKQTISTFGLIEKNATILAALSGGKDSTTLVHLLLRLAKDIPLKLYAAYFNHSIRADASLEEEFVRCFCTDLGLPLITGRLDIPALHKKQGGNLEEIASHERYRFLMNTLKNLPSPAFLATGHTATDQLETFLFRLARGSGPQGLLGIAATKDEQMIRPLLHLSSNQIGHFITRNQLSFYHDSSNDNMALSRNLIRHRLIPSLEGLNKGLYSHLSQTLSLLSEDHGCLNAIADDTLKSLTLTHRVIDRLKFLALHPSLQKRVLRAYLKEYRGSLRSIDYAHIDRFLRAIESAQCGISLPGVNITITKRWFFPAQIGFAPFENFINPQTSAMNLPEISAALALHRSHELKTDRQNMSISVPTAKLIYPLTVRQAAPTDKYTKLGASFSQTVFEMLREKGVPKQIRSLFPLLVNGDQAPIWCASCPVSAAFACMPNGLNDQEFLHISFTN